MAEGRRTREGKGWAHGQSPSWLEAGRGEKWCPESKAELVPSHSYPFQPPRARLLWVIPSQTPPLFTCWQATQGGAGGEAGRVWRGSVCIPVIIWGAGLLLQEGGRARGPDSQYLPSLCLTAKRSGGYRRVSDITGTFRCLQSSQCMPRVM